MARYFFNGDVSAASQRSTFQVFTDQALTVAATDLLSEDGSAVTVVTRGMDFYGPDGVTVLWGRVSNDTNIAPVRFDATDAPDSGTSSSGLLAARPAASAGRADYFATDVQGGTLYRSDGTTWTQITPGVNPSGKILAESVATGFSSLSKTGAFVDDPNMPTLTIPAGSAFYLEFDATVTVAQGTVAAGTSINGQIDVVDTATSTTRYLFALTGSFDFATASGSGAVQYRRIHPVTKTQTALGSPVTVKLRSLWPTTSGLGACQLYDEFTLHAPVLRVVAA